MPELPGDVMRIRSIKTIVWALIATVAVGVVEMEGADVLDNPSSSRMTLVDPSQLDWAEVRVPNQVRFLLIHDMPDFMSRKNVIVESEDLEGNLKVFENLRALYLLAPALSDNVVEALKKIRSLEAIALVNVELTQEGARRLVRNLPRLKTLARIIHDLSMSLVWMVNFASWEF